MSGLDFWLELDRHLLGRVVPIFADADEDEPLPPAGHNLPPAARNRDNSQYIGFYFREKILDRLAEHMRLARLVRKASADLYAHCGTIGAVLCPPMIFAEGPTARWRAGLPMSFGAVSFTPDSTHEEGTAGKEEDDFIPSSFGVFFHVDRPGCYVEHTSDRTYEMAWVYYDKKRGEVATKRPICLHFFVAVDKAGAVRALRELTITQQVVRHKNGGATRFVTGRKLEHSAVLRILATEKKKSVNEVASLMFWMLANIVEQSHAGGFRVTTSDRHGTRATFIIDMLRTPYFFADRDIEVGETGKRRKIFHIVRTHARALPNGKQTFVKSHFRGQRRFSWAGYKVTIGMDNRHNPAPLDFSAGAILQDDRIAVSSDFIEWPEASTIIANVIAGQAQATQRNEN